MSPALKQSYRLVAPLNPRGCNFFSIEKMVFALVGEHVPSPQAKLQIDRTAKLQGDVFLFSFLRDLFTILTQKYK